MQSAPNTTAPKAPRGKPKVLILWNHTDLSADAEVAPPSADQLAELREALESDFVVAIHNIEDDPDRINDAVVVEKPYFILNLVDHFAGDRLQQSAVASLLELFEYQYTGGDALCLATCQDRARTLILLDASSVPVCRYAVVGDVNSVHGTADYRYPVLVSQAFDDVHREVLHRDPIYHPAEVQPRVIEMLGEYDPPLIVEELVEDRLISAVVFGGRVTEVLPLVEVTLSEDSISSAIATLDQETADRCRVVAKRAFKALGCREWGQIDLCIDHAGEVAVTNVRPMPELFSFSSAFRVAADASEHGYRGALLLTVQQTFERAVRIDQASRAEAAAAAPGEPTPHPTADVTDETETEDVAAPPA